MEKTMLLADAATCDTQGRWGMEEELGACCMNVCRPLEKTTLLADAATCGRGGQ